MAKKKIKNKSFWKGFGTGLFYTGMFVNLFVIFFVFPVALKNFVYLKTLEPTYIQSNNIIGSCDDLLKEKIENIAWNVSGSHEFVGGKYDCSQFSAELVSQLKNENISAYCVSGLSNVGGVWGGHTWVEISFNNETIPVEATGGYIIDNETYQKNYEIVKKGYCL